jgi:hypothetical protein
MSKKNFGDGIDALFRGTKINTTKKDKIKSSVSRTTILLDNELLTMVRALAYWERKSLRDFIAEALHLKISHMDSDTINTALNQYQLQNSPEKNHHTNENYA